MEADIDLLWESHDIDQNLMLDREEAKSFMDDVFKFLPSEYYSQKQYNFDETFDKYDEDKNGFLEKYEMAVFLKKVLALTKVTKKQNEDI